MRESDVLNAIRLAMSPHARLWRNNCGVAKQGMRTIRFGIANPGGADLLGFTRIDLGTSRGDLLVFTAVECKRPGGKLTESQRNFIGYICAFGGIAFVATSPEQAVAEHQRQVAEIRARLASTPVAG